MKACILQRICNLIIIFYTIPTILGYKMETQWQDCNISNRLEHVDLIALEHIDNMSRMYIFLIFKII